MGFKTNKPCFAYLSVEIYFVAEHDVFVDKTYPRKSKTPSMTISPREQRTGIFLIDQDEGLLVVREGKVA